MFGCCMQHGSQHGCNMGHLGFVPGGGGRSADVCMLLAMARNMGRCMFRLDD
jgi:hypothetical protein